MKFNKKGKEKPHIEITSLIDVLFILLIFFMISSSFLKPAARIKLPVIAKKEKTPKQNKAKITLTEEGKLYYEKKLIDINELQPMLITQMEKQTNLVILFYGDENISYKQFITVLDVIKKTGVKDVAIGHRAKK